MGQVLPWVIGSLVGLAAGVAIGLAIWQNVNQVRMRGKVAEADKAVAIAQASAKDVVLRAKDEAIRIRDEAERENAKRRAETQRQEERLNQRRESLDHRVDNLEQRERKLDQRQGRIDKLQTEIEKMHLQETEELQRVAGLTPEEAKAILLATVEKDARQDMARVIRQVEAETREDADRRARGIVTLAIQRCATDQVSDVTVSMVALPTDEMKGRIIGRGGRNIRAIENATGVDLVVDDTPEAVILSSFDPVRREIARLALTKLITDGRIHPTRIEKLVEKATQEVEATIREEGERAALEMGVHGLHPELIKLVGQLKYRTSYGQNIYAHSLETGFLAGMMAAEFGANVRLAKEGGLLHDIGKAVDHSVEGPHATIGADLARRYGIAPNIVNCIAAHHAEEEPQTLEAVLVQAADAISGARPGARRESLENYVKRIRALEDVANSFKGVAQSYAIQAGREIRIVVKPEEIDDLASIQLSRDIAKQVEDTMQYPGQIKITVIRETRAVDYAK